MIGWIVFVITFISHVGLIYLYEKQRRHVDTLRSALERHRRTIRDMESQLRLASRNLFK